MRNVQSSILDARRWLCLFMVCCIIFCGIGGIHQRAQAIVGVDDALIAVVIAGLAAMGITFVSTGAYNSLSDYVGGLLEDYADSRGIAPAGLFTGTQAGANALGQLLLNNRFVLLIETFGQWIQNKFSLTDNSSQSAVMQGLTINGILAVSLPVIYYRYNGTNHFEYHYITVTGDMPVYAIRYATRQDKRDVGYMVVSESSFSVRSDIYVDGDYSDSVTYNSSGNGHWKTNISLPKFNNSQIGWDLSTVYSYEDVLSALRDEPVIDESNVGVDINTGSISYPTDNIGYSAGDGAILDVGAKWGVKYRELTDVFIPGLWTAGKSGEISIGYEGESSIGDQVQTGEGTQYVSSEAQDYQTPGLKDVFPFCLPFDIYNFLSCLAADPVAPSFTWRFYVPRLCDETFTVDLSPFDTVAQIVRTMELLAFCIGLAYVTREKFIRG